MSAAVKKYLLVIIACSQFLQGSAKDYPVSLFGISSDGVTLNTRSIQFAIDYIHLKSDVTLHLLEGAVLLGVLNPFDYDRNGFTALILSDNQQNIAITGKGV